MKCYEQNLKIMNLCASCIVDDELYILSRDTPFFYSCDIVNKTIKIVGILPYAENKAIPYIDIVANGKWLVMVPAQSEYVVLYNVASGEVKTIHLRELLERNNVRVFADNMLFHFGLPYNNMVLLFGAGADCIVFLNPETGEIYVEKTLMETLRRKAEPTAGLFRRDTVILDGALYFASAFDGGIVEFDLANLSWRTNHVKEAAKGYIGICHDGESFWSLDKLGVMRRHDKDLMFTGERVSLFDEYENTGRFFFLKKNLIYFSQNRRLLYRYALKEHVLETVSIYPEKASPSGVAAWSVVFENEGLCYVCDTELNEIIVLGDDADIQSEIEMALGNIDVVQYISLCNESAQVKDDRKNCGHRIYSRISSLT